MSKASVTRELPLLLAGPILRRTEASRVCVWLATSRAVRVTGEVVRAHGGETLGAGPAESLRVGQRLYAHLVGITPEGDRFPTNELLAYDLRLQEPDAESTVLSLRELGRGPARITYGQYPLPTFFIPEATGVLNVMHGSCRLLHGRGEDAFMAADETIEDCVENLDRRPSALFLTGDQIYADEVAAPMLVHLRPLATLLAGDFDEISIPDVPRLSEIPLDERAAVVKGKAKFTSDKGHNHLMSFGEFAAMYVTAWNEGVWPVMFPPPSTITARPGGRAFARRYRKHVGRLERARAALPAVRRVLANTPTFMNFDDHDVTDDWNLTALWRESVWNSPTGRRIVSNALAAFWVFQGWGNDPDAYDDSFKRTVTGAVHGAPGGAEPDFDSALWSFDRWSFTAPTRPSTVVLDTRTRRHYDSPEGAARLIGSDERARLVHLARRAGHKPGTPLMIVSAVPVFGFELQERRQKYLVDRVGPYEIDFEAWHSNLQGTVDFMSFVAELGPSFCVLLSGDVHYGVNARASFAIDEQQLMFTQLVSSGQKHAGVIASSALETLGRLLRRKHERLGWRMPPECSRPARFANRIMLRAVNTDEWDTSSPVFLSPRDVRLLGIPALADYRECRVYVRPAPGKSMLVGANNTGHASVAGAEVTHRILTRHRKGTRERTATMDAASEV